MQSTQLPPHGAIRQTITGMEGYCYLCQQRGEPLAECWWPLTPEFFPVKHRGMTRVLHFEKFCRACQRERSSVYEARCRARKQAAA
ncbi:hypothetical protein RHOFW510R12_01435 [Rhodanobacter sp. FW510-R12]|nr:hypothetical protein RHOFW104R8_13405 [Rhodanobacter sp. FW104-R8]KZC28556.1 hypothetical protein RhoFW510T8_10645 [Rhodanobacter sp. FW510-T8]KZC32341.1 hypothetical protein RhoFW510R10_12980 [Rhodanobacter sp. FW510-R10]